MQSSSSTCGPLRESSLWTCTIQVRIEAHWKALDFQQLVLQGPSACQNTGASFEKIQHARRCFNRPLKVCLRARTTWREYENSNVLLATYSIKCLLNAQFGSDCHETSGEPSRDPDLHGKTIPKLPGQIRNAHERCKVRVRLVAHSESRLSGLVLVKFELKHTGRSWIFSN